MLRKVTKGDATMRKYGRVDDNQRIIVEMFRKMGAKVLILSSMGNGCPDLLVAINGKMKLIEVKDGNKPLSAQKLTEAEQEFFEKWQPYVKIVRNDVDARNLIYLMRAKDEELSTC